MRTCSKCEIEKPEDCFSFLKKQGCYNSWCKDCIKAYCKKWVKNNSEKSTISHANWYKNNQAKAKNQAKRWSKNNPEKKKRHILKYQAKHPERIKAHQAVSYAIKTGKLTKKPCLMCGSTIKINAHHMDYSKPLNVIWLCKDHHKSICHKKDLTFYSAKRIV